MNNTQKWLLIGAVWLIAIGLLLSSSKDRYALEIRGNEIFILDKVTADVYLFSPSLLKEGREVWVKFRPSKNFKNVRDGFNMQRDK